MHRAGMAWLHAGTVGSGNELAAPGFWLPTACRLETATCLAGQHLQVRSTPN